MQVFEQATLVLDHTKSLFSFDSCLEHDGCHRMTKDPEQEGTHKDHQYMTPDSTQATQKTDLMSKNIGQALLELPHVTTAMRRLFQCPNTLSVKKNFPNTQSEPPHRITEYPKELEGPKIQYCKNLNTVSFTNRFSCKKPLSPV